jgi:hypothetical protein
MRMEIKEKKRFFSYVSRSIRIRITMKEMKERKKRSLVMFPVQ